MRLFATRDGSIVPRLSDFEVAILRMVPRLIDSVGGWDDDPAAERLTPEVFADDPERSAEFRRLAGELIDAGRAEDAAALDDLIESAAAGIPLTEQQAGSWMRAINQARLILGARLGIEEDGWEETSSFAPDDPHVVLLHLLSRIQGDLIRAVSRLP